MTNFVIEKMTQAEAAIAIEWAAREGWNPGLNDAPCFYAADHDGFFAGKLNNDIIVVGSAVIYDPLFAFCGLYITQPAYRNQGFGMQLTHARLDYVRDRITGIDGVLDNVEKYKEIGYVTAHRNIRYQCNQPITGDYHHIIDLKTIPFKQLLEFDRHYFPAMRDKFLAYWIAQPYATALGYVINNKLMGYGVIRKCQIGYKIGPLFAEDTHIAEQLFLALTDKASPPFFLDIPEPNMAAQKLCQKYNMLPVFSTARMYRNGMPTLNLEGVFGITTFELG